METTLEMENQAEEYKTVLVGNPNVGKSVIFNKLTGIHQKVANFPGITLSYLRGKLRLDNNIEIIDLPGIYGISSTRAEERLALQYIVQEQPDLIINVLDARKLVRNLSLTLQMLEFDIPMIVVLTYGDKVTRNDIDINNLQNILGCPVIKINSHLQSDYDALIPLIQEYKNQTQSHARLQSSPALTQLELPLISQEILSSVKEAPQMLLMSDSPSAQDISERLLSLMVILTEGNDTPILPGWMTAQVQDNLYNLHPDAQERHQLKLDIIRSYQERAEEITREIIHDTYTLRKDSIVAKIDNILLHPKWGLLVFVGMMYSMFSLTFILTDPLVVGLEHFMEVFAEIIRATVANELLASFLADGIIGGVGFVLVFIPQIAVLFLFIALLEHSGYLSRAVFITDKYLEKIGISGTSIAPMLLGFGCNVPGVMATKSISDLNERIVVGLVNPFMSCSARLPVYMIIASAIFPQSVGLVVTSLYLIGIIIAVTVMYILRNTILPGESQFLILEIPELQRPNLDAMTKEAYRHTRKFVENAASWMALGLLLIWLLSITGPSGYLGPDALSDSSLVQESWIFVIGKVLSPIFAPLGWDPRLIVALILGFVAKEIVIGSLGLLYGVASSNLQGVLVMSFTPVSAYAFLVFVLIYTPCIGTYFTMKSQLGKKWANLSVVFSLLLAYILALLTVGIGNVIF